MDLTQEFISYLQRRHEAQGYETDFYALAAKLGIVIRRSLKNYASYGIPPMIGLNPFTYGARRRFTGMHEIAHLLLQETGIDEQLIALYGGVEEAMPYIEHFCNHGASLLLMPDPLVQEVLRQTDAGPQAIFELYARTPASLGAALRRVVFHDLEAHRGGFIAAGRYVLDVAVMNMWLPFWRHDQLRDWDLEQAEMMHLGRKAVGLYAW